MEPSNIFTGLAKKQADLFQQNNVAWMDTMATSWTIQEIMRLSYGFLVRTGSMKRLEDLEDRESIWKSVDEFSKGQTDEKVRNRIAISLLTLEYLLT